MANTEFLVWEPQGFKEKAKSLYHNSFELLYVLLVTVLSIIHSSVVGVGFVAISTPLLFTMSMSQTRRYFWGKIVAVLIQLSVIVILIFKLNVIKKMVHSTPDKDLFIKNVRFYECFGFDLDYNEKYLSHINPPAGENYTLKPSSELSFLIEIAITFMTLQVLYFFHKQQKTVDFFMNLTKNKSKI
jgi:hypothetical protein